MQFLWRTKYLLQHCSNNSKLCYIYNLIRIIRCYSQTVPSLLNTRKVKECIFEQYQLETLYESKLEIEKLNFLLLSDQVDTQTSLRQHFFWASIAHFWMTETSNHTSQYRQIYSTGNIDEIKNLPRAVAFWEN